MHPQELLGDGHTFQGGKTVTRWLDLGLQTVRTQNIGTPNAGRFYAMLTGAMYDAVNGIDRARHIGRTHAIVPPTGAPILGRRDAAAAAAAHAVMVLLAPAQAPVLDQALAADRALFGSDLSVKAGLAWGARVGQRVFAARSADGTQAAVNLPAGTAPGEHRAPFDARFRDMTPFGIASKDRYALSGPPALSSPAYAADFNDVKLLGVQDGDALRNEISRFWLAEAGTPRETGTWFIAAISIVRDRGTERSISQTARLFALLGMAIADGVTVSWEEKTRFFSWRPQPAIREADPTLNPGTTPDPTWTPRVGTMGGSPEWTSGLSTFSGGAARVLEAFYCNPGLDFCFETDLATNGPRCFDSPLQGAEEAGRSRIYQGIHFQFSNLAGRQSGLDIGSEIVANRLKGVGLLAGLPGCAF